MLGSLRSRFLCGVGVAGALFAGAGASLAANHPLPSGGVRKVVHGPRGVVLTVVLYDVAGNVKGSELGVTVPAGKRLIGVTVGLQNRSSRTYSSTPATTATIKTDDGEVDKALRLKTKGLVKVSLKKKQTAYGRLYFLIGKDKRVQTLRLKPFAPKNPLVTLKVDRGG